MRPSTNKIEYLQDHFNQILPEHNHRINKINMDFVGTCSVIATSNGTKKLKEPLLSRFAVIELKAYDSLEEFKHVAMDVLKKHPLAEYIAQEVYTSSAKPNIRDCVRIASLCQTEQDVLKMLRVVKR